MSALSHAYFGDIDIDDLCIWEDEITLSDIKDNPIELLLWVDDESLVPTPEFLDKSAHHFKHIEALHQKAISELTRYLSADGTFMDYYADNVNEYDLPLLTKLIDNNELTTNNFVKLLKLQTVASWYGNQSQIIMDYMIDPEQCDQLLAVKFNLEGHFLEISWES